MKTTDKKDMTELREDYTDMHFLAARLEVLTRLRQNLIEKIQEIDGKIHEIKANPSFDSFDLYSRR